VPPPLAAGVHLDFASRHRRNGQRDDTSPGGRQTLVEVGARVDTLDTAHQATPLTRAESCLREEKNKKRNTEVVAYVFGRERHRSFVAP
jgi:hypothetical protein